MGDKLMLDGREVKVGDRLYCLAFGPQVVTRLLTCNPRSPLCLIDVFGEERDYSTDGKLARGNQGHPYPAGLWRDRHRSEEGSHRPFARDIPDRLVDKDRVHALGEDQGRMPADAGQV